MTPVAARPRAAFVGTTRGASLGFARRASSTTDTSASATDEQHNKNLPQQESKADTPPPPPLYRSQGLFAVDKPVDWTSQDVVAYIRGMLERDARSRGARPQKLGRRGRNKNNNRSIKVGHGGTLDPLATGVLVIGVGSGTKALQNYLQGSKRYRAGLELGYETTTLDLEGNVTQRASFDHVTLEAMQAVVPNFVGTISQVPPIYST